MSKSRRKQNTRRNREHKRSMTGYYNEYVRKAALRLARSNNTQKYLFLLTFEQFSTIVTTTCIYCGSPGSQPIGDRLVCGVDRIDNERGYTLDNVAPCCADCNLAKGNRSKEQFEEHLTRIVNYVGVKNGHNNSASKSGL